MLHVLRAWMIILLLAITGAASADPPERVGRLAFVEGEVSLRTADADGWQAALLNRPLTTGEEMTGYEDLYEHGEWHESAEYGALWYPRAIPPGWAPYRHGRWISMSPRGWTWIDDAPWGFAPFHYGRWVWTHERWGWTPGRHVARPIHAPALGVWIGGHNFSIGLSSGAVPHVGRFPLDTRRAAKRIDTGPRNGHPATRRIATWPPDTSRERLDELREHTREADEIRRQRNLREQRQWLDQRQQQERFELRERSMRSRQHDLDRQAERERRLDEHRRQRLENERRFDERTREQDFERRQLMRRQFERQRRDIETQRHRFIERQRLEQRRRELIDPRRNRTDLERQMFRAPQAHRDRAAPRFSEPRGKFGASGPRFGGDGVRFHRGGRHVGSGGQRGGR